MLIDFTVENFRSIKEPVTLSAVAQRTRTRKDPRIIPDDEIAPPYHVEGWDFDLLPALGIFGANASGKSNVLTALDTLLELMTKASPDRHTLPKIVSFALGGSLQWLASTNFELRIECNATVYTYCLRVNTQRIVHESLQLAPASSRRQRRLFARDWDATNAGYTWINGDHFAGPHMQLEVNIGDHDTYLSLLSQLNVPVVDPVRDWLAPRIGVIGPGSEDAAKKRAAADCFESKERLEKISRIVSLFDTGVLHFTVSRPDSELEARDGYKVLALHKTTDGELFFHIDMESSGTRSLFGLANNILSALDTGTLLIIDELGSNTHPHVTHELVKMFQNSRINTKQAQLIFASHDNTLMSDHLLRRDQIWFTEKGLDGVTTLFPLSDFKPRNDLAMDRAYMDGRYGAVPILAGEEELVSAIRG